MIPPSHHLITSGLEFTEALKRVSCYSEAFLQQVMKQIFSGFEYLHEHDLFHGNFKVRSFVELEVA